MDDDDLLIPEPVYEHLTTYTSYVKSALISAKTGELQITFGVPAADKYLAMPVTDRPGLMLQVTIAEQVFSDG